MSAGTAGGKRKKTAMWKKKLKKYFPSYLSDRTDEVVVFWSALLLRKAEEGIKREMQRSGYSKFGEDKRQTGV